MLVKPPTVRLAGLVAAALLACACGGSSTPPGPTITPNTQGWWRSQVGYELFVRSFADSDGDGTGDFRGLTAHLDALNDGKGPASTNSLGVDFVWLMPVFPSPSYHGYDVSDYRSINPDYGTLDDFKAFVAAAHQRGIKVVLDMVLNHSSSLHPWFVSSRLGPVSATSGWYVWRPVDPGWLSPVGSGNAFRYAGPAPGYYYAVFGADMPDLNLLNPAVEQELVDSMKYWLSLGVDGFRLDAVRYFVEGPGGNFNDLVDQPGTHAFLRRIRAALQATYPNTLLVAEAWAMPEVTASYYGAGDEAQLAFSFDLSTGILDASQSGSTVGLVTALARFEAALAGKDRGFEAPIVSNHDIGRAMRRLSGQVPQARLATATLLAMPGTPFIYYGDEIGMQGGDSDPQKRTPYHWNATGPGYGFTTRATTWYEDRNGVARPVEAAGVDLESQRADPASLWNLHRSLIALRHAQAPLATGDATRPAVTGGGAGAFALLRTAAGKRVLFVANYAVAASGPFTVAVAGTPGVLLDGGLSGAPTLAAGALTFPGLAGQSFAFLSLD